MTTITPAYSYGAEIITPDTVEALAARVLDRVGTGRAPLRFHADRYSFDDGYAHWSLVIMEAHTGYGAEIIDYSNAATIAREFADADILDVDASGTATVLALPLTDDVEARLFPIDPTDDETRAAEELWAEIDNALQCADAFADYPILDEQDYSDRCWDAWETAMSDELEFLGFNPESDDAVQIATYVSEHYQGYAEDGWIDVEWIREAAAEFGIAIPED